MIPTKPTKDGSIDTATGTDAKSYAERQGQKKQDAKKEALKGLEGVVSSQEKEALTTVLEGIINMIIEQEAEEGDIFGKYLFGNERSDAPAKDEPNTESENDFLNALTDWIVDTRQNPLSFQFEKVWDLVQQGKYQKFLKPDDRPVFRLIHGFDAAKNYGLMSNPTFRKKIEELNSGVELEKILDDVPFKVDISVAKPLRSKKLQSWGIEPLTLQGFLKPGEVAILMKTSPNSSNGKFLLNPYEIISNLKPKNVDHMGMVNMLSTEGEVISYGDVKVEKAVAVFVSNTIGVTSLRRVIRNMYDLLESGNE